MQVSRRSFLTATTTVGALGARVSAQTQSSADPLGVRRDFPAADEYTYLNTAYIGLIPRPVFDAGRSWLDRRAHQPFNVGEMLAKTDETRHTFARLINAIDDEIGLLFSTTEGENVVVDALEFKPGDNVVLDDLGYASTSIIHRRLQELKGIDVRIVPQRNGATTIEDFARQVDRRTRLVSVAWVSSLNGFRHDMRGLADLAHAHGSYLYADAIQAIGMGPLDVRAADVDFCCCGSYKWLMAGFGVAPFYVRRELLDRIRPDRVGWRVEKRLGNYRYEHYRTAKKFEFSSLSFGEVYQLAAALNYLQEVGLDRIEAHTLALVERLRTGLDGRGFRMFTPNGTRSSILSFYVLNTPDAAAKALDDARVRISIQRGETDEPAGPDASCRIRVAVSLFNTAADVDRLLDVAGTLRA